MIRNNTHRVYIEQDLSNKVFTGFLTYEMVFTYFFDNCYTNIDELSQVKLKDLDIYRRTLIKANKDESIINCLTIIEKNKISVLPIIDDDNEYYGFVFIKDFLFCWNHFDNKLQVKFNDMK